MWNVKEKACTHMYMMCVLGKETYQYESDHMAVDMRMVGMYIHVHVYYEVYLCISFLLAREREKCA